MTPPPKHGPVLSITIDALPNVQPDDLGSLWTVFTKCKESLQDGARLENISWRLWYHELTAHYQHQPSSPILVSNSASSLPSVLDSGESDWSSDSDTPLPDTSIIHNIPIENQTDPPSTSPALPPTTAPPKSPLRRSSRSQARQDPSQNRRKRNSHPESATTTSRPVLEGHRANSAPSHYRTRTRSHLNIGKIITSLLPETLDVLSARSAALPPTVITPPVVHSATPPAASHPPPTLVVVQPTPRPTPPDTPSHSLDQRSSTSGSPSSTSTFLAVPGNSAPEPTLTPSQTITHPETVQMGDRTARKKFFIRESPTGDAGASVSSSSTTTAKTEAPAPPDLVQNAVSEVLNAAAAHVATKGSRVTKKGKETVRRPAITRHASGHGHAKHPVRLAATTHQRNHSTTSAAAALISTQKTITQAPPATRSKSTTNLAGLKSAGPSMTNLAAQMKPQPPPPVSTQPPQRTTSQLSLVSKKKVTLVPNNKAEDEASQSSKRAATTTKASKTITTKNGQVEVTASSDFSDSEGDDDSSWSSTGEDDEDDEEEVEGKETGNLTKQAAQKAVEQLELFAKVPPRSYSTLSQTRRPQPGLLTSLFHPNPAIVPYLPAHALRAHNSAQNLGSRPTPPPVPTPMTSKSAAAVPQAAQVTVTQVAVNPSGRPGYRLKGKPEGEVEESSDDDEDEEDRIQVSESVAQRKLKALVGKTRREASNVVTEPPSEHVQMTSDAPMVPLPVALPHPYNLPAPAPVATPRTTRREMLQTEMSESLRRNILWERETNRRLLRGAVRPRFGMGMLSGLRPLTSTGGDNHQVSGGTRSGDEADRKPPVRMARNYSSDNFHAVGW